MSALWETLPRPTVAGGTGGSGTRVVTEVLRSAGVFMGSRLNRSGDALDLAEFDWRWGKRYLERECAGETPPFEQMEAELESSLREHLNGYDPNGAPWGWKHPHAYLLLPWLDTIVPDLRFIHVIRDGRWMARSRNQLQLHQYGGVVLEPEDRAYGKQVRAIKFWSWANERAADYGEQQMNGRYLRMRFEDICSDPHAECSRLIAFANGDVPPSDQVVLRAAGLVSVPREAGLSARRIKRSWRQVDYQLHRRQIHRAAQHSLERFGYL